MLISEDNRYTTVAGINHWWELNVVVWFSRVLGRDSLILGRGGEGEVEREMEERRGEKYGEERQGLHCVFKRFAMKFHNMLYIMQLI